MEATSEFNITRSLLELCLEEEVKQTLLKLSDCNFRHTATSLLQRLINFANDIRQLDLVIKYFKQFADMYKLDKEQVVDFFLLQLKEVDLKKIDFSFCYPSPLDLEHINTFLEQHQGLTDIVMPRLLGADDIFGTFKLDLATEARFDSLIAKNKELTAIDLGVYAGRKTSNPLLWNRIDSPNVKLESDSASNQFSRTGYDFLLCLKLEKLILRNTSGRQILAGFVPKLVTSPLHTTMKYLHIENFYVPNEDFSALTNLDCLETLILNGSINDYRVVVPFLAQLKTLRRLDIDYLKFLEVSMELKELKSLVELPQLKWLDISRIQIPSVISNPKELRQVFELRRERPLEYLGVLLTGITDEFLIGLPLMDHSMTGDFLLLAKKNIHGQVYFILDDDQYE